LLDDFRRLATLAGADPDRHLSDLLTAANVPIPRNPDEYRT